MRRLLAIAAFAALLCGTSLAADFETGEIGAVSTDCTVQRSCVQASVGNAGAAYIQVTGTFTATLEVEGTADGSTWASISTDITAAGTVQLNVAGLRKVRLRCSAYTSGTASVAISLSPATPSPTIDVAALNVDNSGVETKLDTTNTHLAAIDAGKLEEATFTGRVGEVQAEPTANTVLGRIKSVEDKLDTLLGVVDTQNDEMQVRTEPGSVVGPAVGATFPVSAAALPLPTGAAAETTLADVKTAVEALAALISGGAIPVSGAGGGTQYTDGDIDATATGTVAMGATATDVLQPLSLDASGYLNVNVAAGGASGGTSSSFGAAMPATGTAAGFYNASSGNMVAARVNDSSQLEVSVEAGGVSSGTAGTASADVVTVQGIASMTPLEVQSNSANLATQVTAEAILAKQPALGTAGTASADVITVQGATSMTPVAVTLPAGATPYSYISLESANQVNVKASAGTLYTLTALNMTSTPQYLLLFDKATAPDQSSCSANSDCPVLYFPIPTLGDTNGAGITIPLGPLGIAFSNGIGFSIIGSPCEAVASCQNEVSAAAGVVLTLGYK